MKDHSTNNSLDKQPRCKACMFAIQDGGWHSNQFRDIDVVAP